MISNSFPKLRFSRLRAVILQGAASFKRRRSTSPEQGNAQVEFIGVVIVLLIPIVFLVITFSRINAAQVASLTGAHAVARSYAISGGQIDSHAVAQLALTDQGFDPKSLRVDVQCPDGCSDGGIVTSNVSFSYSVPGLGWTGKQWLKATSSGFSYRGVMQTYEN